MALPEPFMAFWGAFQSLSGSVVRTPWGMVVTDPRFPDLHDANHASVLVPTRELTLPAIRRRLLPALRRARATHQHIEFMDMDEQDCPALRELQADQEAAPPDVVMALRRGAARPARTGVEVREIVRPDEAFWSAYRASRNEFGEVFTDSVMDQLVRWDREVFAPAGGRFLAGFVDGAMAGFTSFLSLAGVGYVENVVTLPAFRRRGVATAMVTRAVKESVAFGDRQLYLFAEEGGMPHRLYEGLGFRVRGRAVGFTRPLDDPPAG